MTGLKVPYPHVGVSIVAYRPHGNGLASLLDSVLSQVGLVVLVDNGGAAVLLTPVARASVEIIDPGANVGVAAGHNLALALIFARGCSHALLFDQDSLPKNGMIGKLLETEQALLADSRQVAAVGPNHLSATSDGPNGFVKLAGCRPHAITEADPDLPNDACGCDFLRTSGTLMRSEVFGTVGRFDEDLFIDNVDLEWCYRAAGLGFRCFGCVDAFMEHSLGDYSIRLPLMKRLLVIHGPVRVYYMTRNRLFLYRLSYVPIDWKLADLPRMVIKLLALIFFVRPRVRYLQAALAGIRDGIKGVGGEAGNRFQQ